MINISLLRNIAVLIPPLFLLSMDCRLLSHMDFLSVEVFSNCFLLKTAVLETVVHCGAFNRSASELWAHLYISC